MININAILILLVASSCIGRAIRCNSPAVRCFAGRAKNGYLWAAFLARRSVRSLAGSFPLLSLAGANENIEVV